MNIMFRVDASRVIGTGHLFRSLSLAHGFQAAGWDCTFLMREFESNKLENFTTPGIKLEKLPKRGPSSPENWLGTTQEIDVADCIQVIEKLGKPDLLVVDHYALDAQWEHSLRPYARKALAIDDTANRPHSVDWLVDQNYHRNQAGRYSGLTDPHCAKLLGPSYALLRGNFAEAHSQASVRGGPVKNICVFMGGSDQNDITSMAVRVLAKPEYSSHQKHILVGSLHGRSGELKKEIVSLGEGFVFHSDIHDMASFLANMDLAIGAGGSSSWERCCVGLPTLVVILAENQRELTIELESYGAVQSLGEVASLTEDGIHRALNALLSEPSSLSRMSAKCLELVDGKGVSRVVNEVCAAFA